MSWSSARVMLVSVIFLALAGSYPALAAEDRRDDTETHCVVTVLDEMPSGAFVMSEAECFATFAEAMASASEGAVQLPLNTQGETLFNDPNVAATISAFTLGIHYDGYNGNGQLDLGGGVIVLGWLVEHTKLMGQPDLIHIQRMRAPEALQRSEQER